MSASFPNSYDDYKNFYEEPPTKPPNMSNILKNNDVTIWDFISDSSIRQTSSETPEETASKTDSCAQVKFEELDSIEGSNSSGNLSARTSLSKSRKTKRNDPENPPEKVKRKKGKQANSESSEMTPSSSTSSSSTISKKGSVNKKKKAVNKKQKADWREIPGMQEKIVQAAQGYGYEQFEAFLEQHGVSMANFQTTVQNYRAVNSSKCNLARQSISQKVPVTPGNSLDDLVRRAAPCGNLSHFLQDNQDALKKFGIKDSKFRGLVNEYRDANPSLVMQPVYSRKQ